MSTDTIAQLASDPRIAQAANNHTAIPFATQRAIFGCVVFGRIRVRNNPARQTFETYRTTAYGQDYIIQQVSYAKVAAAVAAGKAVFIQR